MPVNNSLVQDTYLIVCFLVYKPLQCLLGGDEPVGIEFNGIEYPVIRNPAFNNIIFCPFVSTFSVCDYEIKPIEIICIKPEVTETFIYCRPKIKLIFIDKLCKQ